MKTDVSLVTHGEKIQNIDHMFDFYKKYKLNLYEVNNIFKYTESMEVS